MDGTLLREAREAQGLSLADLSVRTRIPEEHLAALEENRSTDFPTGPYREAYWRTVCDALDIELPEELPPGPGPPPRVPLMAVRAIALLSVLGVFGVMAWGVFRGGETTPEVPEPAVPDQVLEVAARRTVKVQVRVDGELVWDDVLPGGQSERFEGTRRLEVKVPAVDAVWLKHNGRTVVPQGRQDAPRTLVFIDDARRSP